MEGKGKASLETKAAFDSGVKAGWGWCLTYESRQAPSKARAVDCDDAATAGKRDVEGAGLRQTGMCEEKYLTLSVVMKPLEDDRKIITG